MLLYLLICAAIPVLTVLVAAGVWLYRAWMFIPIKIKK